ncbi:GntR family transcriptional regulator [Streptomyces sp. NPDC006703]|uniref:GntR family transcriptional regulator n=1 Tax=Streptomyces sp. NPDC006703 TaxID=3364759 RepID=UPI0036B8AD99
MAVPVDLLGEAARIVLWQIAHGTYKPGDPFPGVAELEYLLGFTAPAVHHARRNLLQCGVLHPGPPIVVAPPKRWRLRMPNPAPGAERTAQRILLRIKNGSYPGGTLLPSASELAEQFGISRLVVQDALRLLAAHAIVTEYPPRVGRPLIPPRPLKYRLVREALREDLAKRP